MTTEVQYDLDWDASHGQQKLSHLKDALFINFSNYDGKVLYGYLSDKSYQIIQHVPEIGPCSERLRLVEVSQTDNITEQSLVDVVVLKQYGKTVICCSVRNSVWFVLQKQYGTSEGQH